MSNEVANDQYDFAAKHIGAHGKPIIDKITLTAKSPNKVYGSGTASGGYKDHEALFLSAAKSACFDKGLIQSQTFKHYKFATRILLESCSPHCAYLAMGPKNPAKYPFIRLEFNPNKLGPHGMEELYASLVNFIDTGGEWFWDYGNISKMDVALDLHGISIVQVRFLNKWGTTTRMIGTEGRFDTIYIGQSTSRQTKIYDKALKAGLPDDLVVTRLERTLRPQCTISNLIGIKNPFLHLSVADVVPSLPSCIDPNTWEMFLDSLAQRGPAAPFKLLDDKTAKGVAKHMEENPAPCWQPEVFWQHWPEAVEPLVNAFKTVPFVKAAA